MVESRTSNHVSAVAVIPVEAGHLNSEGMVKKGKYEIASAKRFRKGGEDIPYVSAQALRKYIRDYMEIVVNQPGYYQRVLRKTTKKDPVIADPVEYFEDDYLGISHPLYTNPNDDCFDDRLLASAMNRRSPFLTTGLIGIEGLSRISASEGWVHPTLGTPLPYKAEFSTGYFQGIFALELDRIGRYENYGDVIEMDPTVLKLHRGELDVEESDTKTTYLLRDRTERQRVALDFFFDSIMNLFGGGKATMFATSLSPALLIGMTSEYALQLPNTIFKTGTGGTLQMDFDVLSDFVETWGDRLSSPVAIGYRAGTMGRREERRLVEFCQRNTAFQLTTPGGVKDILEVSP